MDTEAFRNDAEQAATTAAARRKIADIAADGNGAGGEDGSPAVLHYGTPEEEDLRRIDAAAGEAGRNGGDPIASSGSAEASTAGVVPPLPAEASAARSPGVDRGDVAAAGAIAAAARFGPGYPGGQAVPVSPPAPGVSPMASGSEAGPVMEPAIGTAATSAPPAAENADAIEPGVPDRPTEAPSLPTEGTVNTPGAITGEEIEGGAAPTPPVTDEIPDRALPQPADAGPAPVADVDQTGPTLPADRDGDTAPVPQPPVDHVPAGPNSTVDEIGAEATDGDGNDASPVQVTVGADPDDRVSEYPLSGDPADPTDPTDPGDLPEIGDLTGDDTLAAGSADPDGANTTGCDGPAVSDTVQAAPTFSLTLGGPVDENAPGARIGTVHIVGGRGDEAIVVSDPRLEVVDGELRLRDGFAFDFESEATLDVAVSLAQPDGSADEATTTVATLTITDVNEAPTALDVTGGEISVGAAAGAVVAKLRALDPDAGDVHSYAIAPATRSLAEVMLGDPGVVHSISTNMIGNVKLTSMGLMEGEGGSLSVWRVRNPGDAPRELILHVGNDTIAVNAPAHSDSYVASSAVATARLMSGTTQLAVKAAGPQDFEAGMGQTRIATDSPFEIVGDQIVVKAGVTLDAASTVILDVTATDAGGLSVTRPVEVRIVAALPPSMTLTGAAIAENAAGADIGRIDIDGAANGWAMTVSDDRFEVVNGALKLKDGVALDHEAEASVAIDVRAESPGGIVLQETFDIAVDDVNEAPTSVTLAPAATGAAGTARLTVRIGGEAFHGDPRYEIVVDGVQVASGEVDWARDTLTEGRYAAPGSGGADDVDWRDVTVDVPRGADGIGSVEVRFPNDAYQAGVGDRNLYVDRIEIDGRIIEAEDPSVRYDGSASSAGQERMYWTGRLIFDTSGLPSDTVPVVAEGEAGAVVGRLHVADPDAGETFSYDLSDDRFEVRDGVLKLKDEIALDEGAAVVDLRVEVRDSAGHAVATDVRVGVGQAADVPNIRVATGFRVAYHDFDGRAASVSDIDWTAPPDHVEVRQTLDFEETAGSFWQGGATDTFAARATGQISVEKAGTYTFRTNSDDGSVLMIDGSRVVTNDGDHGMQTRMGTIDLEPGIHSVEVLYFENYGHAGLHVDMAGPGNSDFGLMQADQTFHIADRAILPLDVDVTGAASVGSLTIEGLPGGSIVMSAGNAVVADGGTIDLTGWDVERLEIAPPEGFSGTLGIVVRARGLAEGGLEFNAERVVTVTVETSDDIMPSGGGNPVADDMVYSETPSDVDWIDASEVAWSTEDASGEHVTQDHSLHAESYGDDQTAAHDRMEL